MGRPYGRTKNTDGLTRSDFSYLIAAVRFFHPRFKGHLGWSKAVSDGWDREHITRHAVPMLSGHASLVGTRLSAKGYARLCGGIILQQRKGLRPSDMLALLPEDINFSEDSCLGGPPRVDIALGYKSGTKSGLGAVSNRLCRYGS